MFLIKKGKHTDLGPKINYYFDSPIYSSKLIYTLQLLAIFAFAMKKV